MVTTRKKDPKDTTFEPAGLTRNEAVIDERTASSPDRFNSANVYIDGTKKGRKQKAKDKAEDEAEAAYNPQAENELFQFWRGTFQLEIVF